MRLLVFLILAPLFIQASDDKMVEYFNEKKYDIPLREVSIIVSKEGYYPQKISVFKGEKVRIFLTNTQDYQSCLVLPDKEVFLSAKKGEISEKTIYFQKLGVHEFYCPTKKIKGKITVLERPTDKIKRLRKLASEKDTVKIWYPREE